MLDSYIVHKGRNLDVRLVVIGKKIVPAKEAYLVPAEPAHEEDVVKWECSPLLADDEKNNA